MEIFVDENLVQSEFTREDTVEEALRSVQNELRVSGRLVVGIRCDGQEVHGNVMEATLGKPTSDVERLDVLTGTRGQLVADAMEQASTSLSETRNSCREVAELLIQGQTAKGTKLFGECLRLWQQLHEAVAKSIDMLELDPSTTSIGDEQFSVILARPAEVLTQIKQALQAQDYVLLADVLQYELDGVTDQWQKIVTFLCENARARDEPEDCST